MDQSLASTIRTANAMLIERGELDTAADFFTPDYVAHATDRDLTGGPPAVRRWLQTMRDSFSDLEVQVDILLEAGDRVAWQRTVSGEQTGSFQGFPASNRRIVWRDMITSRFQDGRIAEEWVVTDLAERLLTARKAR